MNIYILNYEGKSWVSKLIQVVTWSKFSHTALATSTGQTIEAWHRGGVTCVLSPWTSHTPDTPVTIYKLAEGADTARIWAVANLFVGSKYDFRSLLGFVPGLRFFWGDSLSRWFCSHLVAEVCNRCKYNLFSKQTPLYKISPGMIDTSQRLIIIGKAHNMVEFEALIKRERDNCTT